MTNPFERLSETRGGQRVLGLLILALGGGLAGGAFWLERTRGWFFEFMPFVGALGVLMGLGVFVFPGRGRTADGVERPSAWIFGLSLLAAAAYQLWFLVHVDY